MTSTDDISVGLDAALERMKKLQPARKGRVVWCRRCQRRVVWVGTQNGKTMPVDAASFIDAEALWDGNQPQYQHGQHISHYGTCPNPRKQPHNKRRSSNRED